MLIPKYIVVMDSKYMKVFTKYTKACEYMRILQRQFPRKEIEIEPYYE